ncbi:MAG TPA: hypothetical protein VMU04_17525 [Candidatus Acidoferrum sp.]|nr:hypothetical protein [Candidatus Acidoferrum sp.]
MQAPTHILTGALIQRGFEPVRPRALGLALTAVCALLSHGLLDRLANLTYHLPDPDFQSPVWIAYHACLLMLTIVFLYLWWKPYKWGIIFGCLPDVDWVFIHGQQIFHFQLAFYRQPHLHRLLGRILDAFPPFTALNRLPNLRHHAWAILPELVLLATLLFALVWLKPARPRSAKD